VTFAPYGASTRSFSLMTLMTCSLLRDGGKRMVTFADVVFQMTLPALDFEGKPSIPVTVSQGLHVLFKYISGKSS